MTDERAARSAAWRWSVCGLLLVATMLNYMDRQTLSQTAPDLGRELGLSNERYGDLEMGFGLAFAAGGIVTGILADSINVRWMYPIVLVGWSLAGIATAFAAGIGGAITRLVPSWAGDAGHEAYLGLLVCRVALGLFEAGQWPCALVTTQRLLAREDRSFGNSILTSGASLGAVFTPLVAQALVTGERGTWRAPFVVIGIAGMAWVVPWLAMIRARDLARPAAIEPAGSGRPRGGALEDPGRFWRRFAALAVTVIAINITWHYFRAWLPKFLREYHGYDRAAANYFTSAYYIAADVGCIATGAAVTWLVSRGREVHTARMITFLGCALLTALSLVAAGLGRGPLLLAVLLVIGFGALGLFPNYYAFTQELSIRHQGKVTGALGAITWVVTAVMQKLVGRSIDATRSYAAAIRLVGLAPLVACAALLALWGVDRKGSGSSARD
jgi:ACS family hexuronate transporter-like MFS transporter